jgi:hypothetical protein
MVSSMRIEEDRDLRLRAVEKALLSGPQTHKQLEKIAGRDERSVRRYLSALESVYNIDGSRINMVRRKTPTGLCTYMLIRV